MTRLNTTNVVLAEEIIARYPRPKSALIPLLHLAQEQTGYVSDEAMEHIGELIGITPAEVLGTCSFYEMLKREPVGRYVINICTNLSCQLLGAEELLEHAENKLGIKSGGTTEDGLFTLEDVECVAACTEAPCAQINYRYRYRLDADSFDAILERLRSDTESDIPPHGTLARVRQRIEPDRCAGIDSPEATTKPKWYAEREPVIEESV